MTVIAKLVELVEEVSGYVVPDRDHERFESVARGRARACGLSDLAAYLRLLKLDRRGDEWRALLSHITVNESYLFRAPQQFEALCRVAVADLVTRRPGRSLLLWSAGCANGEEAATLAVVLAECAELAAWDWRILATDVDDVALDRARSGSFGARAVARVPPPLLQRHFDSRGGLFQLKPALHRRIDYRHLNLVQHPLGLPDASCDVVFLRNVLIYFRPQSQQRVAAAVSAAMADDGYLFVGTSESLWQLCPGLEPFDLGGCFCYRKRPAEGDRQTAGEKRRVRPAAPTPGGAAGARRAAARRPEEAANEQLTQPAPTSPREFMPSRTAFHRAIIDALLSTGATEAAELIKRAAAAFPEDPVMRALEGLVHDLGKRPEDAVRAYRAALYLDPSLFQVRLMLADCMDRLGWKNRALREYRGVLELLAGPTTHLLPGAAELGLPDEATARARCRDRVRATGRDG